MKKNEYREALYYIAPFKNIQYKDKHGIYPEEKLKELVDKEDPMVVIERERFEFGVCSKCKCELRSNKWNYCPYCRQKLNWEVKE